MRNQMTIKYHIEIPDDYFMNRDPSPDYTREQRESARTRVLEEMNDFLSDVGNSVKNVWKIRKKLYGKPVINRTDNFILFKFFITIIARNSYIHIYYH